jgi:hypothetical protein
MASPHSWSKGSPLAQQAHQPFSNKREYRDEKRDECGPEDREEENEACSNVSRRFSVLKICHAPQTTIKIEDWKIKFPVRAQARTRNAFK